MLPFVISYLYSWGGWGFAVFESELRQRQLGSTVEAALNTMHAYLPFTLSPVSLLVSGSDTSRHPKA